MSQSTDHDRDFRRMRGKLFNDYRLRIQTAIFEAVTMRVCGRSFALTCSANYRAWIRTLQTEWHPLIALTFPSSRTLSFTVNIIATSSGRLTIDSGKPKTSTLTHSRRRERPVAEDQTACFQWGRLCGWCFWSGFGHGPGAVVYCSIQHVYINLLTSLTVSVQNFLTCLTPWNFNEYVYHQILS